MRNNIDKKISYESEKPSMLKEIKESFNKGKIKGTLKAATSREELEYLLSPVYSPKQLKDLDEDQLMDLLDEVIDRVYKIKMKRGGIIKDPTYNIYKEGGEVKPQEYLELEMLIQSLSDEEKKNLQFMLDSLKKGKQW